MTITFIVFLQNIIQLKYTNKYDVYNNLVVLIRTNIKWILITYIFISNKYLSLKRDYKQFHFSKYSGKVINESLYGHKMRSTYEMKLVDE